MGLRSLDQFHFPLIFYTPLSASLCKSVPGLKSNKNWLITPPARRNSAHVFIKLMMHKDIQQGRKFCYIIEFAVLEITPISIKLKYLWRIITVSRCGRWRGEHNPFHTSRFQAGVQHVLGALNTWINQSSRNVLRAPGMYLGQSVVRLDKDTVETSPHLIRRDEDFLAENILRQLLSIKDSI